MKELFFQKNKSKMVKFLIAFLVHFPAWPIFWIIATATIRLRNWSMTPQRPYPVICMRWIGNWRIYIWYVRGIMQTALIFRFARLIKEASAGFEPIIRQKKWLDCWPETESSHDVCIKSRIRRISLDCKRKLSVCHENVVGKFIFV